MLAGAPITGRGNEFVGQGFEIRATPTSKCSRAAPERIGRTSLRLCAVRWMSAAVRRISAALLSVWFPRLSASSYSRVTVGGSQRSRLLLRGESGRQLRELLPLEGEVQGFR